MYIHRSASDKKLITKNKVLIIAIDGFNWDILEPLINQNKLPNIQHVMQRGVYGEPSIDIQHAEPCSTVIWATILTGKVPDKHKIKTLFYIFNKKVVNFPPSSVRKEDAIWSILTKYHRRAAFISFLNTWPAEKINGHMVSCFAIPWVFIKQHNYLDSVAIFAKFKPFWNDNFFTQPSSLMKEIVSFLRKDKEIKQEMSNYQIPFIFPVEEATRQISTLITPTLEKELNSVHNTARVDSFPIGKIILSSGVNFLMMFETDKISTKLGISSLKGRKMEVVAVYLGGLDIFSHIFWPKSEDKIYSVPPALEHYYIYIDDLIGKLLDSADSSTTVYITGDHSYRYDEKTKVAEHKLERTAFIISGEKINSLGRINNVSILDFAPTILYQLDIPVSRGMDGRILKEVFVFDSSQRH